MTDSSNNFNLENEIQQTNTMTMDLEKFTAAI